MVRWLINCSRRAPIHMPGVERPHGTRRRYEWGCRCLQCRIANAGYHTSRRLERTVLAATGRLPEGIPHGRPSTYNNHGCRCDLCRQAWREKRRVEPPPAPVQTALPGFPEPSPEWVELQKAGPDRKRTLRHQLTFAAGKHPATGAALLGGSDTCGSCRHAWAHVEERRTYWKCDLVPMTHGAATDIRLKWPACTKWDGLTDQPPPRPYEPKPSRPPGAHKTPGHFR